MFSCLKSIWRTSDIVWSYTTITSTSATVNIGQIICSIDGKRFLDFPTIVRADNSAYWEQLCWIARLLLMLTLSCHIILLFTLLYLCFYNIFVGNLKIVFHRKNTLYLNTSITTSPVCSN